MSASGCSRRSRFTGALARRAARTATLRAARCATPRAALFAALFAALCTLPARAENLVIPGSGNNEFVLGALARAFNAAQSAHTVVVPPSTGSAGALRAMEERSASVARIGRPLKESERKPGVDYIPLGDDAVVFAAGAGVSVKAISAAQVIDIYTGKLADWRELGGKAAPIRAIGREATDASRQVIAGRLPAFQDIRYADAVKVVHLDPQVIELLDRYPASLGFINRSALGAARSRLTALVLDGIAPLPENLANGSYPLRMSFGLLVRRDAQGPAARQFLAFIRTPVGNQILRAHGVLPAAGP